MSKLVLLCRACGIQKNCFRTPPPIICLLIALAINYCKSPFNSNAPAKQTKHKHETRSIHDKSIFSFKVTPSNLVISENGPPLKINVTSTVPIICRSSATCSLAVNVLQDNYDIFLSKCSLDMKSNDKAQSLTLEVNAKRDFVNDGDKVVKLKLTVKANADVADWVGHKELQDITVFTSF